jgi:hypothetical protein
MEEAPGAEEQPSISMEAEFARMVRLVDLYVRQKADLFLQHYLFDPADFLIRQLIYLSVLAALLVAGTLAVMVGAILFVSTLIPLWAALLIGGLVAFVIAGVIAYVLFSRKIVLKTPTTPEVLRSGEA